MNEIKEIITHAPYWSLLNYEQKEYALKYISLRHYNKGNIIHGESLSCLGMFYLLEGNIRAYMLSEDGKEITLFKMTKGEACVLSASCMIVQITFDTQLIAESECDLLILNPMALSKLSEENIYLKCFMYETLTKRFSSVVLTMQSMLFSKIDRRIARFLISEYSKEKNEKLEITQEEIAININTAREVVTRTLKQFEKKDFIELKRGCLIIKDIEKLNSI